MSEMVEILDDAEKMRERDTGGMLSILGRFDEQIKEALEISEKAALPSGGPAVRNIVISGLGGSAIGGDFLKAYLGGDLRLPVRVNRHYSLPGFADEATLALICSYSGNTEETISTFQDACRAGAQIVCISSGGKLLELAQTRSIPFVQIPSGYPPRAALGYSAIPLLMVLSRFGLAADPSNEIRRSQLHIAKTIRVYGPDTSIATNAAKGLALKAHGRLPLVYGSQDRLEMVAVRWRGQFSENGKSLAFSSALPEMNHNEIVGWAHPEGLLGQSLPIFLRDREDHPRVQLRAEITRDLVSKKARIVLEYWSDGESWLDRLWSLILLGDYASVYLAFLNQEDPTPVQVIDDLKQQLSARRTDS